MASTPTICMIGSNSLLQKCLKAVLGTPEARLAFVLHKVQKDGRHKYLQSYCERHSLRFIPFETLDDPDVRSAFAECRPDIIVSVCNPSIMSEEILGSVDLTINFHDAPLPRYAGRNSLNWAVLNGETDFGVTWHSVVPEIDAGDIIAQRHFPISDTWSILDLLAKCIETGEELFSEVLPRILAGDRNFKPQDFADRTYFYKNMKPFDGSFPFRVSAEVLKRLQRATAYYPGPNPFFVPKVSVRGIYLELVRFDILPESGRAAAPGSIVSIGETGIGFATADATATADVVRSSDGVEWDAAEFARVMGIRVGDVAEQGEMLA